MEQERKPINFCNFKSEVIVVPRGFILKWTDVRTWIHCSGFFPPHQLKTYRLTLMCCIIIVLIIIRVEHSNTLFGLLRLNF